MSVQQIAAEALRLSPQERAQLAESLWESLEDPFAAPCEMTEEKALDVALERDREIQSGAVKPISHEELMAKLRR
jgi:putative addiction module component (TIGR02574 family)